jgi:hypothetical protein
MGFRELMGKLGHLDTNRSRTDGASSAVMATAAVGMKGLPKHRVTDFSALAASKEPVRGLGE